MKKLFSIVLSVAMVFCMMPSMVFGATAISGATIDTGNGKSIKVSLNDNLEMTVTNAENGKPLKDIFSNLNDIKATIEGKVNGSAQYSFEVTNGTSSITTAPKVGDEVKSLLDNAMDVSNTGSGVSFVNGAYLQVPGAGKVTKATISGNTINISHLTSANNNVEMYLPKGTYTLNGMTFTLYNSIEIKSNMDLTVQKLVAARVPFDGTVTAEGLAKLINAVIGATSGTITADVTIVANPTPSKPSDNVTNSGTAGADDAQTNADLSNNVSVSDGEAKVDVDQTTADKIVDKAVANGSKEVVLDATTGSSASEPVSSAQVGIPTATLEAIAEKTDADVIIKSDVAEVKIDNETAAAIAEQATGDTVQIIADKVKEDAQEVQFELKVVCSNGTVIRNFKGGNVSVTVPVTKEMASKKLVCVYIDDNGIYHKVDGSINEEGTHYTFTTGHFSTYAIMSEEEADAVIKDQTAAAQKAAIKKVKTTVTLSAKNVKKGIRVTVKVPVDQKADKTGIILYRSMKKDSGYAMYKKVETKSSTYIITNTKNVKGNRLTAGKRYYYKARAYKVIDGKTYYGPMSTVKYMKAK